MPGFVRTEREIEPVIDRVFSRAAKRIIVASFASHVHRIQQVLDIADAHDRHVAFVGRSMVRNMGVARDLGYLKIPPGLVVNIEAINDLPDDRVVLVCTGSQGEPMAALSRMANRDHQIRISEGDTVILASSLIPGNENAVYRVINGLTRWGATSSTRATPWSTSSGHAAAGELPYCYNIVKPRNVMPVHGEWRHLRANAELAVGDRGAARARRPRRGRRRRRPGRRRWPPSRARCRAATSTSTASSVGDVTESSLKDRRILGDEGFISVIVVVDLGSGKVVAGPEIHARGFGDDDTVFDDIRPKLTGALEDALREGIADAHAAPAGRSAVRSAAGSAASYRRRPMIIPVVVEV